MKRTRSIVLAAILLLSTMVVFVTPAVAGVTNVWVVPGDPDATGYVGTEPDDELVDESVIVETVMGTTFQCSVLVLNRDMNAVAENVHLKVLVRDAANIENIQIGAAELFKDYLMTNDDNSGAGTQDLTFTEILDTDYVPRGCHLPGWVVRYPIGNIPKYANDKYGNPEDDIDSFYPEQAQCYIRVPFTINFYKIPEPGFIIYAYAEDHNEPGADTNVHMVWSHDCVFYNVPEFTTIAIPAIALLGLFAFYRRKQKK